MTEISTYFATNWS